MTSTTVSTHWNSSASNSTREAGSFAFSLRFGRRQLAFFDDPYVRCYYVKPIFECTAGAQPGHLEVLILRRWLLVLSMARSSATDPVLH